ncbi:unnamed protein product [Moneuplotes crassus]|uniref:AP2/ERF domain-containing protein n=1 Tax=Euplotes crassus TaxID=5936 RepID=A0AAD2D5U3_EUPCR|nr:unnamed protein product [Moneuplotes crassus]
MFTSNPAEVQFDVVMHQQILFLANNFCLCPGARKVSTDSVLDTSTQGEDLVIKQPSRTIKSRKKNRLLKSRNTKEGLFQLQRILDSYAGTEELVVARSAKSKNNTRLHKSGRRSSYIGVSKNGDVWQALIMIDSKKTYIGSYHTEKEAAMAYDFFSIVLKQLAAKTNFDYSLTLLKKMVHNYHSNDQEFVPSECL